jgi:Arc/MetJ family transcription regulator
VPEEATYINLDELVGAFAPSDTLRVDDALLAEVVAAVGLTGLSGGDDFDSTLRQLIAERGDQPLAMRAGQWQIDMSRSAFQTLVASALIVSAILAAGATSTAVIVLAAIAPFLVDVERVKISASDRMVLAALHTQLDQPRERRELYDGLSADLRHEVTFLEFVDILERLDRAGMIDHDTDLFELPAPRSVLWGYLERP